MITFGSLFAGIGGFDLGFERIGLRCAWQVEIDNKCNEVLDYHWPDVQRYGDVKDVGRQNLESVDLVVGGFPCQDVSVAGRREGLDGERSGLWFEFIRIVEELKPKWVVVENVPGLLSSNEKRDFAVILSGLGECGYWWAYRVLDAQNYGVPQRRRRVFVVGCLRKGCAQEVLFERESSPWDIAPSREAGEKPAYALAASVRGSGDGHGQGWNSNHIVKHALSAHNQRNDPDGEHFVITPIAFTHSGYSNKPAWLTGDRTDAIPAGGHHPSSHQGIGIIQPIARPLAHSRTTNHYDESQQTYVAAWNWQSGGDVRHSFGLPNLQAHQVPAVGVRRLTPTECERLQGFPEIERCVIIDVCLDRQKNYVDVEIRNPKSPRSVGNAGRTGSLESVRFAAKNLSTRNQLKDERVPPFVGINCGERTVVIHSQEKLLLSANIAGNESKSPLPIPADDFARLLVGLTSIVERIISNGAGESQANEQSLIRHQNGKPHVRLSGSEITQCVKDVMIDLTTHRKLLKSITSSPLSIQNIEHRLTILCSYVLSVITGYILPEILNANSFRIEITTRLGWTAINGMKDTARYRMLGNAVCVPVAEWIGRRIKEVDQ